MAANPAPALEADPNANNDANSILVDGNSSSTASITSSVVKYRKIHGRTFHNYQTGTDYYGPNDEKQNEGLDLIHQTFLQALDNKLFLAPISPNPQRVLDIGTGTGIWAVDFADQFPSTEVIGTDLSPIQPAWVPPNCKFELDDAQQIPWAFPDNHFDFIHIRYLSGSITDWKALIGEVYRCLKPGGWFEHLDFDVTVHSDDDTIPADSVWKTWGPLFHEAGEKMGRTFHVVDEHQNVGWLGEAGFDNIEEHPMKLPLGSWPADPKWKEVGAYNFVATMQSIEGYALFLLTKILGWSFEEVQIFIAKAKNALVDKSIHAYFLTSTVFGQKPLSKNAPETTD